MKRAKIPAVAILWASAALAQYPGHAGKPAKEAPELRAIAVVEWTGAEGKPTRSRLVPVAVLDGGELEDGSVYLARPEPMAVESGVEYELLKDGNVLGLYDVRSAGQEQGTWVGYGAWRQKPSPKPKPDMRELAKMTTNDDAESDRPTLHRKHHPEDSGSSAGTGGGSGASGSGGATADPDRPTLHKKSSSDSGDQAGGSTSGGAGSEAADPDRPTLHKKPSSESSDAGNDSGGTPVDPDRPTLHKKDTSGDSGGDADSAPDPDRPRLKKSRGGGGGRAGEDTGYAESLPGVTDPDRPTLKRGKSSGGGQELLPSLLGMPVEMQQAVAVSDAKNRQEHPWGFTWSNPEDEARMKAAMEKIAGEALGLKTAPPAAAVRAARKPVAGKQGNSAAAISAAPTAPTALEGEQFRVFELAYGAGATMVLTAYTSGPSASRKFVTLVAQPDLYGNVLVLLKNVADGRHLDDTPRMRIIDAVDALADNRGELLFELRGETQRQFALYRVLRGQAERIFIGGGGNYGIEERQ